jgi:hypothetical protein
LEIVYLEICHYNSQLRWTMPFSTLEPYGAHCQHRRYIGTQTLVKYRPPPLVGTALISFSFSRSPSHPRTLAWRFGGGGGDWRRRENQRRWQGKEARAGGWSSQVWACCPVGPWSWHVWFTYVGWWVGYVGL